MRVGVVVPVTAADVTTVADTLTDHHDVPTTLAVSPLASERRSRRTRQRDGQRALAQLAALSGDEMLDQPYVPINVAALSEAGISGEISAQMVRGDDVLRSAGLRPDGGPWVDTASSFTQGDAGNLASGLQLAGATQAVISDDDLASGGREQLHVRPALHPGPRARLDHPGRGVRRHLEHALHRPDRPTPSSGPSSCSPGSRSSTSRTRSSPQPRGVVVAPPAGWRPSAAFMDALLAGLSGNPALKPVTVTQLFAQVPAGGNHEPAVRQLQSGPGRPGHHARRRRRASRSIANSWRPSARRCGGHPTTLTSLGDTLLTTEAQRAQRRRTVRRAERLRQVLRGGTTGQITLGHRAHRDLHVAAGRHPGHGALLAPPTRSTSSSPSPATSSPSPTATRSS